MMWSTLTFRALCGCLAIVTLLAQWSPPARAAELVMFHEEWCEWCERWEAEVGVVYAKTSEGRRAPLRRIDIHGKFPGDVKLKSRPHYTPTFVLVDKGQEVGRIEGYPGEDFFWAILAKLIQKLRAEVKTN